ncbi:MAG: nitrilase family protein [Flavobacteriales bacterium]|nr:MAG: nitrilase family protein [Flavobacteriales bacterium]
MQNLTVTIIQTPLHWESIDQNLEMFSIKLAQITEQTNLIVLPEMFTTGFSMNSEKLAEGMEGKSMQWIAEKAKEKNCVITGSLIIKENGYYYNRLIWMRSDGTYEAYDKRHLFRFANENDHYSAGEKRLIVDLNGWKICPLICYDLRFPVWSRNVDLIPQLPHLKTKEEEQRRSAYDCLLYIANWPEPRRTAWQTLLQARAHENQCYVIGVNRIGKDGNGISYSGDSAVIDAKGNVISKTKTCEESIETVELNWRKLEDFRKKFPVGLDADEFELK